MKRKIVGMALAAVFLAAAPVGAQKEMSAVEKEILKNLERSDWIAKQCEEERGLEHGNLFKDMSSAEMLLWVDAMECIKRNIDLDWRMREQGLQGLTPIR